LVGDENVTLPGPVTTDQVQTTVEPAGKPSSEAVPSRTAAAGSATVRSSPALTTGGAFADAPGFTVTVRSSPAHSAANTCQPVRRSMNRGFVAGIFI